MSSVGYVYDDLMLLHFSSGELEKPERIVAIHEELQKREYLEKMIKVEPKFITNDELLLAHDSRYINKLNNVFSMPEKVIKNHLGSLDSMFGNKDSLISASIASGSTLNLMKEIVSGKITHGVAIVRPPGHHCANCKASGFCFYNNVAISTKYGIEHGKRIAIVDWDIHFGDGTFNILKNTVDSLVISIHRYDYGRFYPGTGKYINTPNLLSIPINKIAYDEDYYKIFDEMIIPKLKEFEPDIIIISAGFDSGEGDPLGEFHITPNGYYEMTKKLLDFKKSIMIVLEGGYNLTTISNSMAECTRALLENQQLI